MIPKGINARLAAQVLLCGLSAALFVFAVAWAQVAEVPYMTGRITENVGTLSPEVRAHLTEVIRLHEEANDDQLAVLIVPSLEGAKIEEFAAQVLETWRIGTKGKDNGVLLLVSPSDRRVRIAVGSGLRHRLSEESTDRIIRDVIAPAFQNQDYDRGIDNGVHAILGQLEGDNRQDTAARLEKPGNSDSLFSDTDMSFSERFLIGSFIFGIIGLFTIIGVLTPGVGWFLYLFLIPFWAMFPMVVVGVQTGVILLIAYLVLFPAAKLVLSHKDWYRSALQDLKSKGVANIGGFTVRSGSSSTWTSS
jgi:uncharacterized protein